MWRIEKLDIICGILSIGGLLLWFITKEADIAIIFSIIADGLAATPTLFKSYKHPATESHWVYSMGIVATGITMLTITNWNFATYGFPIYIFFLDLILFLLIKFRIGILLQQHHV